MRMACLWFLLSVSSRVFGEDKHGSIGVMENISVMNNRPVTFIFKNRTLGNIPCKIQVNSATATINNPIMVVTKQQRRITSWQVPLQVTGEKSTVHYQNTSRILCYDMNDIVNDAHPLVFSVTLSTYSVRHINVTLLVSLFDDFVIKPEKNYVTQFSPSEPVYHSFSFKQIESDVRTVIVKVTSSDHVCFTVSIQDMLCPVRDLNQDIIYEGKYQTVNKKGGLIVQRNNFKDGFMLVFVSKVDDYDCIGSYDGEDSLVDQVGEATFSIKKGKTATEYVEVTVLTAAILLIMCSAFVIFTLIFYRMGRYHGLDLEDEINSPAQDDTISTYLNKTQPPTLNYFVTNSLRNKRKAMNYFWHINNIAVFYAIPVVQLMVFYQRTVNDNGDLDTCYHNFQCAYPLYFTDFNHIYSNISYFFFGALFICITFFKSRKIRNMPHCGVPKYYGVYYTMGFAVICEGILSACYHICPNQSNFQFDTTFMYVIACLVTVKLYQNRHPDINASAYTIFSVLGYYMILAMVGILRNSTPILLVFIFSYLVIYLVLSLKMYYFGRIRLGFRNIVEEYKVTKSLVQAIKPHRTKAFLILVGANLLNYIMSFAGFLMYPDQVHFGTFLLYIFLANDLMYCCFYVGMKIIYKEKICAESIFYGLLAICTWLTCLYFFGQNDTNWRETPAESRAGNVDCILLDFYDDHDIWHLLSAAAMFFTFMFLQTLDDDLFNTPRTYIYTF